MAVRSRLRTLPEDDLLAPTIKMRPVGADVSVRVEECTAKEFRVEVTCRDGVNHLTKKWSELEALQKEVQEAIEFDFQFPRREQNNPKGLRRVLFRFGSSNDIKQSTKDDLKDLLDRLLQLTPIPVAVCSFLDLPAVGERTMEADQAERPSHQSHFPIVQLDYSRLSGQDMQSVKHKLHKHPKQQSKSHHKRRSTPSRPTLGDRHNAVLLGTFLALGYTNPPSA